MSDLPGLALALLSLALMVGADTRASMIAGALVAGLAAGVRVQTALLTVPALALPDVDAPRRGRARSLQAVARRSAVGGLLWAVPLLWLSGGCRGYLAALGSQAGEDFAWVDMLWANPTPRRIAMALDRQLRAPLVVERRRRRRAGLLAAIGFWWRPCGRRRALALLFVAFGPYALFHLLLQETSHVRYALPLLPPVAWLASRALVQVGRIGLGVRVRDRGGRACSMPCPPPRSTRASAIRPFARSPTWRVRPRGRRRAACSRTTPSTARCRPPRRGGCRWWRRSATRSGWASWTTSGAASRATVWFLADPRRTDLDLFDRRSLQQGRGLRLGRGGRPEFGGARPSRRRVVPPVAAGLDGGRGLVPDPGGWRPCARGGFRPRSPAHRGPGAPPARAGPDSGGRLLPGRPQAPPPLL